MIISIEIPTFKDRFLEACIQSVFAQTSDRWHLSLVWDGGSARAWQLLQDLQARNDPRITVYFTENQGIANARQFLTTHSQGAYILPLDDDDMLAPEAVERFLHAVEKHPDASLIRAKRDFVGLDGAYIGPDAWFPFSRRSFQSGMVKDLFNQAQPYLIQRAAFEKTQGWRGFADFKQAGEDCDIFLQLEEVGHFELIDAVLYHYRVHNGRASEDLTSAAAFEMWRRLADQTIERIGLPLSRETKTPPFDYVRHGPHKMMLADLDIVSCFCSDATLGKLLDGGIAHDAIHVLAPGQEPDRWRSSALQETSRPLVCVTRDLQALEVSALDWCVERLSETGADMITSCAFSSEASEDAAAPRLPDDFVLARRYVFNATNGFSQNLAEDLQAPDLCAKARLRDFQILVFGNGGDWVDRQELQRKWSSFPDIWRQL